MVLLSFAFAAAWTVTSAMAAHLPRIVEAFGATPAQAVFAGMMIGPAQVAARVMEASMLSRFHPLVSTRLACHHASDRCLRHRHLRRGRRCGLRPAARRWQRHLDHRARDAAARDLRARELRLSARPDRRAIPHLPGAGAPCVRIADRADGTGRCGGLGGPQSRGAGRPDALASRSAGDGESGGGRRVTSTSAARDFLSHSVVTLGSSISSSWWAKGRTALGHHKGMAPARGPPGRRCGGSIVDGHATMPAIIAKE